MLAKFLFTMLLTFSIEDKQDTMNELQLEVTEAQQIVGLAETMYYVEKIGRIQQLSDEITVLEERKAEFK